MHRTSKRPKHGKLADVSDAAALQQKLGAANAAAMNLRGDWGRACVKKKEETWKDRTARDWCDRVASDYSSNPTEAIFNSFLEGKLKSSDRTRLSYTDADPIARIAFDL